MAYKNKKEQYAELLAKAEIRKQKEKEKRANQIRWTKADKMRCMVLLRANDGNVYQTAKAFSTPEQKISRQVIMRWRDNLYQDLIKEYDLTVKATQIVRPDFIVAIHEEVKIIRKDVELNAANLMNKIIAEIDNRLGDVNKANMKEMAYALDVLNKIKENVKNEEPDNNKSNNTFMQTIINMANKKNKNEKEQDDE